MWWPPLWESKTILTALPVGAEVTRFDMEFVAGDCRSYFIAYKHDGKAACSQVTEACFFRESRLANLTKDYEEIIQDVRQRMKEKLRARNRWINDLKKENKRLKQKFKNYTDWVMQRPNQGDEIPF